MSTQGSMFPCVASPQFQSQASSLHGVLAGRSTTGDHKFKGEFGFAHLKPADVAKNGSFATQTIITVYCRPKSGLTLDVLSNVVMQLCTHTSVVVEQVSNPLARAQFFAQAWASVIVDVPVPPPAAVSPPLEVAPPVVAEPPAAEAPPVALLPPVAEAPPAVALVPPVAEAPPAAVVPPVDGRPPPVLPPVAEAPPVVVVPPVTAASRSICVSLLLQEQTQEATANTKTSDPTLFFNMQSLIVLRLAIHQSDRRLAEHGVRRKRLLEGYLGSSPSLTGTATDVTESVPSVRPVRVAFSVIVPAVV